MRSEQDHADQITPMIYERLEVCDSILDIGCSSGVLLAELRKHYNCSVAGVEWNWRMRDACLTTHGIKCYKDMSEISGRYDRYDLIILSHVLEHTLSPLPLLRDIHDRLDGFLFVQVPLLMPGIPHPLVFTESSAAWLVGQAGFKVLNSSADQRYFTIWAGKQ